LEPLRPLIILLYCCEMLTTVNLNDQTSLNADEVDDVLAYRNLPAEVMAADLVSAEAHPETDFRVGHRGAQFAPSLKFGPGLEAHSNHLQR
jgi:hypothetical protein